jgi:hypothetical protein
MHPAAPHLSLSQTARTVQATQPVPPSLPPWPQAEVRGAHEASVWAAAWHPTGHLLATGAADYAVKFWCRWVWWVEGVGDGDCGLLGGCGVWGGVGGVGGMGGIGGGVNFPACTLLLLFSMLSYA